VALRGAGQVYQRESLSGRKETDFRSLCPDRAWKQPLFYEHDEFMAFPGWGRFTRLRLAFLRSFILPVPLFIQPGCGYLPASASNGF
jgi:hypothetical protein